MKRLQVKGKETDELKKLYKNLQQYWDALKQSNPTKPSRKYSSPSNNSTIKPIELENNSPRRYLMSMLQQDPSEAWMMMRTKDVASKEILRERWEAIESGKFKGRRLFVPMAEEEEECESDMNPNYEEVRSVSFGHSKDEHESSGSQGQQQQQQHFTRECSYSSSTNSPCCLLVLGSSVDKDREHMVATVAETRVVANRGSYAVLFGGLAFAFLILVAMCMSASGGCDHQVILVPT